MSKGSYNLVVREDKAPGIQTTKWNMDSVRNGTCAGCNKSDPVWKDQDATHGSYPQRPENMPLTAMTTDRRTDADERNGMDMNEDFVYEMDPVPKRVKGGKVERKWKQLTAHINRVSVLVLLLAFLVYLGFVLYLNPDESVFLCVITPLVVYICLNSASGGKLKSVIARFFKKIKRRVRLSSRVALWGRRVSTIAVVLGIFIFLIIDIWDNAERWRPLGGLVFFILLSVVFSKHPRQINWIPVVWGLILQFMLGLIILRWRPGYQACQWLGAQVTVFLGYTDKGSIFVFGNKYLYHPVVFKILPVCIFFGAIVSVLYYLNVMQMVIKAIAIVLQYALNTTRIESFATAMHIFVGQVASSLVLKPFFNMLTISEIHAVMTSGYATVAGTLFAAYVEFGVESSLVLKPFFHLLTVSEIHAVMTSGYATVAGTLFAAYVEFGVPAEHVISASFMSAPAALAIAKISIPETKVSKIRSQKEIEIPSGQETNLIDALSVGATQCIKLIAYVVVNLIAFISVLAFLDAVISYIGARVNYPDLNFQLICSYVFMPLATIMGVPWSESNVVGSLIGTKIIINEFLAYSNLGTLIKAGQLQEKTAVLATYILCGFGSIAALGINLGALSSAAPERRSDFARLSVRSMINGNLACFMTACIAGLLFTETGAPESITTFMNDTSFNVTDIPSTLNVTLATL